MGRHSRFGRLRAGQDRHLPSTWLPPSSYNKETGKYHFEGDDREAGYMLDFYENLINEHPIVSIEDPFQEEGWEDWVAITAKLGDRLQFVGDDLLVTNPARLAKGIELGAPPTPCWSS